MTSNVTPAISPTDQTEADWACNEYGRALQHFRDAAAATWELEHPAVPYGRNWHKVRAIMGELASLHGDEWRGAKILTIATHRDNIARSLHVVTSATGPQFVELLFESSSDEPHAEPLTVEQVAERFPFDLHAEQVAMTLQQTADVAKVSW